MKELGATGRYIAESSKDGIENISEKCQLELSDKVLKNLKAVGEVVIFYFRR